MPAELELRGQRVMVIGLGVSGRAAARFLASGGASLVMTDLRCALPRNDLPPGEFRLGAEDPAWLDGVDLVVASPGVPPTSALMRSARSRGIHVIGELELGARSIAAPIVAVTGTNGKSTVTVLLGDIFKAAGKQAFIGGNLGTPLVEAVGGNYDVVAIEVSSYQLESIETFAPRVSVHLNLTDDHLDRYASREEYGRAKEHVFEFQRADDWAILNRDDPCVWRLASRVRARVFSFGMVRPEGIPGRYSGPAIWAGREVLYFDDGARNGSIAVAGFPLPGSHNLLNAMAASAAALAMGIEPRTIELTLAAFRGLPHRIEFVCERNGVRYVDDSKGTNVGAVVEALTAVSAPVILIAGGVDKGGEYDPLLAPLRNKVRLLILIGAARDKMRRALRGATSIEVASGMADAVTIAAANARAGDTVLLSPACSSFDQFKDYAERGRVFQELVRAL